MGMPHGLACPMAQGSLTQHGGKALPVEEDPEAEGEEEAAQGLGGGPRRGLAQVS